MISLVGHKKKRSLPHPRGARFYAPRPRRHQWCHHHEGKACNLRSALCQTKKLRRRGQPEKYHRTRFSCDSVLLKLVSTCYVFHNICAILTSQCWIFRISLHADRGSPEPSKGFLAVLHFPQQSYQNCVAVQIQESGCNPKRQYFYTFCFWECWIVDGTTHSISASQCWIWQVDDTLLVERRNFPAVPPEHPSSLGFSIDLSTELTSRCCNAGLCSFSRKAHVSKLIFSAFFPARTGQGRLSSTAFLRGLALGDRCAGKKKTPCPGKITPFPGRGLFWHPTRWQKNTFGDARAFSRQQSCWQKNTFGDARPFPGWPQKLAEKNPALAKKHPVRMGCAPPDLLSPRSNPIPSCLRLPPVLRWAKSPMTNR